jgi:hypothetical protein
MTVESAVVIWQGKTKDIEFSYTDFKGNKSRRNVTVNKVLFDEDSENFYINGICNERQAERDFKESNISTMIKVGSNRYDFQEWMLTLDVDTSEWLDKGNNKTKSEPVDVPKEKISFSAKIEEHNRKQQIKLDELKASKPNTNMFLKVLFWFGVLFVPYIFAWFTLRKGNSTKSKVIAFGWLLVFVLIFFISPEPEHKQTNVINQIKTDNVKTVNTKVEKPNQFGGLNDCDLAKLIVADYEPIIISLSQYLNSNTDLTYQQLDNWKSATNFQGNLDSVADKYPTSQKLSMHNSRLASGLGFRADQAFRDTFSGLRKSDNQGYEISPQWQLIQNDALQIIACAENK